MLLMDQVKIGRFIAQKRKELGLTQRELAEKLGIGDKAVSKWECGRGMPDNSIMVPLCNLLGINVNELLSGESLSENNYNEKAEDIIMTLIQEKETLVKKDKKYNIISGIGFILLIFILLAMVVVPVGLLDVLSYLFDGITSAVMNLLIISVILMASKKSKDFFRAFALARRNENDADELLASLLAVKLAIASSLMGGGLIATLEAVFALHMMASPSVIGPYIARFLLSLFYGILFAILLLPLKMRLETMSTAL